MNTKFLSLCFIREKKLLTSSEDYGKDLTGVQNLRKKHQRLEAELNTHEARIQVRNQNLYYLLLVYSKGELSVIYEVVDSQ